MAAASITADYAGHRIPIFAKASAIIPMQGKVQSTRDDPGPVLYVHVFNGAERSEFVYYDDDGETLDYRKGQFRKRVIAFDPATKQLSFSRPEGSFAARFRKIKLILHGFGPLQGATVNGEAASMRIAGRSHARSTRGTERRLLGQAESRATCGRWSR